MIALRKLVATGSALAALLGLAPAAPAAAGVRLSLPAPTGAYPVGTAAVHLVDRSRLDPLAPSARPRELMVRLWYPAVPASRGPVATYLPPIQAAVLTRQLNTMLGTGYPADLLTFPTHSRVVAPAAGAHRPVLLFSPGLGLNAALYTGILEELASRGYVVAAIDHTFDAPVVEFPGGRVEIQNPEALTDFTRVLGVRVADTRFVLDRLTALAAGDNPDAEHRPLPGGLARALDLTRVAAFGHSMGSMTAIGVIAADPRLAAGAALDGNPLGLASLTRPFLMLGNPAHRRAADPDWATFYDHLRGPRLHLVVDGIRHGDLSDLTIFKATVDLTAIAETGPLDGPRSLAIQRRYLTAWFDHTLRNRPSPLLRAESPRFPEVDFQP